MLIWTFQTLTKNLTLFYLITRRRQVLGVTYIYTCTVTCTDRTNDVQGSLKTRSQHSEASSRAYVTLMSVSSMAADGRRARLSNGKLVIVITWWKTWNFNSRDKGTTGVWHMQKPVLKVSTRECAPDYQDPLTPALLGVMHVVLVSSTGVLKQCYTLSLLFHTSRYLHELSLVASCFLFKSCRLQ